MPSFEFCVHITAYLHLPAVLLKLLFPLLNSVRGGWPDRLQQPSSRPPDWLATLLWMALHATIVSSSVLAWLQTRRRSDADVRHAHGGGNQQEGNGGANGGERAAAAWANDAPAEGDGGHSSSCDDEGGAPPAIRVPAGRQRRRTAAHRAVTLRHNRRQRHAVAAAGRRHNHQQLRRRSLLGRLRASLVRFAWPVEETDERTVHPSRLFHQRLCYAMRNALVQWTVTVCWSAGCYGVQLWDRSFDMAEWFRLVQMWPMAQLSMGMAVFVVWADAERRAQLACGEGVRRQVYIHRHFGPAQWVFVYHWALNLAWMAVFYWAQRLVLSFSLLLLLGFFSQMQAVQFGRLNWLAGILYVPWLVWVWYAAHVSWQMLILNPEAW